MELDLKQIEQLIKLVKDNRLDHLSFAGLAITKSKHEPLPIEKKKDKEMDDEELIYWSASKQGKV